MQAAAAEVEEPEAEASFGPAAVDEACGKHCVELNSSALDELAPVRETICVPPAQGATVVISSVRSPRPSLELRGVKEEGGETPRAPLLPTDEDDVAGAVFPPSMLDEEAVLWSDSSGYEWDGPQILKSPF
jgi:hypothetical protein